MTGRGWIGVLVVCLWSSACLEGPDIGADGGGGGNGPVVTGLAGAAGGVAGATGLAGSGPGFAGSVGSGGQGGGLILSPDDIPTRLAPLDTFAPGSVCRVVEGDDWCWYNPLPCGDNWEAIGPAGPRDIVAISREHVLHHDGHDWSISPAASMAYPHAVWGSSPTDVWVVGGDGPDARAAIAHGDGQTFETVFRNDGSGFLGVWGSGPDDVWAVGYANVAHFDGQTWTKVDVLADHYWLSGSTVDGSGPDDIWIGGDDGMFHFDGTTWTRVTNFDFRFAFALGVRAPDDVWASATNGGTSTLVHFDGVTWTPTFSMSTNQGFIDDLDVRAPDDAWAVGTRYDDDLPTHAAGFLLHWNGQTWTEATDAIAPVRAVLSTPRHNVAVGDAGTVLQLATGPVASYTYLTSGLTPVLYSVWGASPSDVWAVGTGGSALHYDGHTVSPVTIGEDVTLYDVWGTAPDQIWAVGEAGTALRWSGAAWVPFPAGTVSTLRAVFATAPDDVWIGGAFATLLRFDGRLATPVSVPGLHPNATINDIHGTGPSDIWIIGTHIGGAFVSHFDGSSWSAPVSFDPVITDGDRVFAASPNDVWAATSYRGMRQPSVYPTEFWHYDGATWSPVPAPSADDIWMFPVVPLAGGSTRAGQGGSFAFGPDDVWSVWRYGSIARRTPAP